MLSGYLAHFFVRCLLSRPSATSDLRLRQVTDLSCTLGSACGLDLTGHNLADTNGVVILAEGQCGDADAIVADWGDAYTQVTNPSPSKSRCAEQPVTISLLY